MVISWRRSSIWPDSSCIRQFSRAEILFGVGLGKHGDSFVGPAGNDLGDEQVGEHNVSDLVRQDRGEPLGIIGAEDGPTSGDLRAVGEQIENPGAVPGPAGCPGE